MDVSKQVMTDVLSPTLKGKNAVKYIIVRVMAYNKKLLIL
jgi:hypothetical protein